MRKVPDPVQPDVTPLKDHAPATALFFAVPCRVRVFPLGVPDCTVI
jgi:hypothetical protein